MCKEDQTIFAELFLEPIKLKSRFSFSLIQSLLGKQIALSCIDLGFVIYSYIVASAALRKLFAGK